MKLSDAYQERTETVREIWIRAVGGVITKEKVWRGCLSPHRNEANLSMVVSVVLILGDVSVIGPGRWRLFESEVLPPSTENGSS
jgi:hypothetical protein